MTLTLEIKREIQDVLVRQAAARGVEVGSYAASLLEGAAQAAAQTAGPVPAQDMVELFAPLRGLSLDFERDRDPGAKSAFERVSGRHQYPVRANA